MSIHPVTISPVGEAPAQLNDRPAPGQKSAPSKSAPAPKPESPGPETTAAPAEIPQDEVQVQREGQANEEIVIRYMDHAGNLILQVPSSEVLSVAQGIDQDLEQQTRARVAESAGSAQGEGGRRGH
jgi:hypothetical protein